MRWIVTLSASRQDAERLAALFPELSAAEDSPRELRLEVDTREGHVPEKEVLTLGAAERYAPGAADERRRGSHARGKNASAYRRRTCGGGPQGTRDPVRRARLAATGGGARQPARPDLRGCVGPVKTRADEWFETYLLDHGYTPWAHERDLSDRGIGSKPDFLPSNASGQRRVCDVKAFEPNGLTQRFRLTRDHRYITAIALLRREDHAYVEQRKVTARVRDTTPGWDDLSRQEQVAR